MSCTRMKDGDVIRPHGRRPRGTGQTHGFGGTRDPERSPKKGGSFISTITTKAMGIRKKPAAGVRSNTSLSGGTWSDNNLLSNSSSHQSGTSLGIRLPPFEMQDTGYPLASSSHSNRRSSRDSDVYQIRAPPPGSYQDDDTGPSPKNLVMAVMGVKSAVNQFAKVLTSDMSKYPEQLKHMRRAVRQAVHSEVDRANHFKFLVQAFVCIRMFEGFEAPNGFFGITDFDELNMSSVSSFADFAKFKDKAATISGLLANDSTDASFLGKFCFMKFKSIADVLDTNHPSPFREEEWSMIERDRHPHSEFYQSFLKVAVSVWLLHRLVYSFEQGWNMLGWKTFPQGCKFQRQNMESVVPGGFEEDNDETGTDVNTVVGFLVIPGFQVSKSVVKCEVYLRNMSSLDDGKIMDASERIHSKDQSLEKPSTDKTPANYAIQELRKPHSGPISLSARDEQAWNNSSSNRLSGETLGNRSRVPGRSPGSKSGHLDSNDRARTSTHYYPPRPVLGSSRQSGTRRPKPPNQTEVMNTRAPWAT